MGERATPSRTIDPHSLGRTSFRVHIAAVGFEVERLFQPMRMMHADVAILLTRGTDRPKALETLREITKLLKRARIKMEAVNCDLWETNEVVNTIGGIVASAPSHSYFYNASTGPKPACIAGVVSASFWPIQTYYIAADYDSPVVRWEHDYRVRGPPRFFTALSAEGPDEGSMAVMTYLVSRGEAVRKKDLIESMQQLGLIGLRSKRASSPQALHGQVDTILWRLERWGFVRLQGHGKSLRILLTEHGKGGYVMFHHRTYPRVPPSILNVR